MGPRSRNRGFNRLSKALQSDREKIKHNKSLKNKVRDVQRLLKKSDLPATVRVVQERMLDVLKETIKDKAKEDKQKKIEKRSKKVIFFEKKKIFRKYKSCLKELNETENSETRNSLLKELEEIKQQWNYVYHFPGNTKYISLFPLTSHTNADIVAKQEKIQKTIAKKVAGGELEDASSTIWKMGKASQKVTKEKPKLVLSDEESGRVDSKGDGEDGEKCFPFAINRAYHVRSRAPLIMGPKYLGRVESDDRLDNTTYMFILCNSQWEKFGVIRNNLFVQVFNYFYCLSCLIESGDQEPPPILDPREDDFFMDSSPSPGIIGSGVMVVSALTPVLSIF
ncbi:rRNA-processing protein EFG1 [Stylophora pistillata]|uniref:rRNA-processing protein EFG1 n=1 Tax=Stylophora pistillata TaxID=50429 RepID=A0A2B4RJP4_STYPI|nr:rRNA-processing protein EFG1 [Stylophora pistillata]